jgi:hypothetical protein
MSDASIIPRRGRLRMVPKWRAFFNRLVGYQWQEMLAGMLFQCAVA